MICASTTWFVDNSALEMNAASRSFNLRNVVGRTALIRKDILTLFLAQVARAPIELGSEARPSGRAPSGSGRRGFTVALAYARASNTIARFTQRRASVTRSPPRNER